MSICSVIINKSVNHNDIIFINLLNTLILLFVKDTIQIILKNSGKKDFEKKY
jgi:hypothetical protein